MSAIRLARAATAREPCRSSPACTTAPRFDGLLAEAGSGLATQGIPSSPGVLEAATNATVIVPWNDPAALVEATERYELAAILAEPIAANMGVVPPEPGFLELLRERADKTGALLVFDEVITGFRVARGGAQELYGTTPDLSILAQDHRPWRARGGVRRAPAVDGADRLRPATSTRRGRCRGTRWRSRRGWRCSSCWTRAPINAWRRPPNSSHRGSATPPRARAFRSQVQTAPGLLTPFFSDRPVRNYADAAACDLDAYGAWCRALLSLGVYPPPSQFEAWFPSIAHTPKDVERTVEAARLAFAEMRSP